MDPENNNPYAPPKAPVADYVTAHPSGLMSQVAFGQKRLIWSILLQLGSIVVAVAGVAVGVPEIYVDILNFVAGIAALGFSISGVMKTGRGLQIRPAFRALLVLCILLPLINLVTLVILNSRATRALRKAGYRVGFLGASAA